MTDFTKGKPLLENLPERGYQDNPTVQAMVGWLDEKLTNKAKQLQNFYRNLDPDTAEPKYLDFLAYLCGLSGDYWDRAWSEPVKRTLIKYCNDILWSGKGTMETLSFVLNVHKISFSIWQQQLVTVPVKVPVRFGAKSDYVFIKVPVVYQRYTKEYKEILRTLKNYCPVFVDARVCYDHFTVGYSAVGDPVFSVDSSNIEEFDPVVIATVALTTSIG